MVLNKIKAFTLAEVLITLTIIGVVASLTIPSLINNIGDQQNKIAWRKAYADLSQATIKVVYENGGSLKSLCAQNSDCFRNMYLPYLNYIKSCNASLGYCWNSGYAKKLNGSVNDSGIYEGNYAGVTLANGVSVMFRPDLNSCPTGQWWGNVPACGQFWVDVNGEKGPNTIGKDVYGLYILENSIKPMGTQGDNFNPATDCTQTGIGWGCSALYLYQ